MFVIENCALNASLKATTTTDGYPIDLRKAKLELAHDATASAQLRALAQHDQVQVSAGA